MVKLSEDGAEGKINPRKSLCKMKVTEEIERLDLILEDGHYVHFERYTHVWVSSSPLRKMCFKGSLGIFLS